jgi:hypothetical protein
MMDIGGDKGDGVKERVIGRVGWLFILSDVWADDVKTASLSAYIFYT